MLRTSAGKSKGAPWEIPDRQDHGHISLVHTYFLVVGKVFFATESKCLIGSLMTSEKDPPFQLIFFVWVNRSEQYS